MSIPKGINIDQINLENAKYLCSLPKIIGQHPDNGKDIIVNSGIAITVGSGKTVVIDVLQIGGL